MTTLPTLRICIVNWNAGDQLRACLDSVFDVTRGDGFRIEEVCVVDNASSDGSADGLEERYGNRIFPFRLIRNTTNRGFAAACNQGLVDSKASYRLLLNPDTEVYADSFADAIGFMERPDSQNIGILGVRLVDEDKVTSRNCARFPTPSQLVRRSLGWDKFLPRFCPPNFMVEWDHEDSREVDQVMGAFYLMRGTLYEQLQGLDERFFVYYEDLDFAFRAKQAGWISYYWVGTTILHRGRGTTDRVKAKRLALSLHSRILYSRKHFSPKEAKAVTFAVLYLEPISRFFLALLRGSREQIKETSQGFALLRRALQGERI